MSFQTVPIEIRFRDIDMNQHVNNATYFTYMENARSELLKDEMISYLQEGIQFIVSEANCKYKRPIKLTDKLICEVGFAPVRPTACDIFYLFKNEETGVTCAEGFTRMVLFNTNNGRPMAIPGWFIEKYLK